MPSPVDAAMSVMRRGAMVRVVSCGWNGCPPDVGAAGVPQVIPAETLRVSRNLRDELRVALRSFSFQTNLGRFMPFGAVKAWRERHDDVRRRFEGVRNLMVADRGVLVDHAREVGSKVSPGLWAKKYPDDGSQPPMSFVLDVASKCEAAVPSAEGIYSGTWVAVLAADHPLLSAKGGGAVAESGLCEWVTEHEEEVAWEFIESVVCRHAAVTAALCRELSGASPGWSPGKRAALAGRARRAEQMDAYGSADDQRSLRRLAAEIDPGGASEIDCVRVADVAQAVLRCYSFGIGAREFVNGLRHDRSGPGEGERQAGAAARDVCPVPGRAEGGVPQV